MASAGVAVGTVTVPTDPLVLVTSDHLPVATTVTVAART
jgi:endonuclease/exonuclease/phosphatase family metal-dependent hydrolase